MLLRTPKDQSTIRIGELLVKAELADAAVIEAAVSLASRMRVPLGRVLSMEGHIGEAVLQAALEVQSRIADRLVDLELGAKALQLVARKGLLLDDAIAAATLGDAPEFAESSPASEEPTPNMVPVAIPEMVTASSDVPPPIPVPPVEPAAAALPPPIPVPSVEPAAAALPPPIPVPPVEPAAAALPPPIPVLSVEPGAASLPPSTPVLGRTFSPLETGKFDVFFEDQYQDRLVQDDNQAQPSVLEGEANQDEQDEVISEDPSIFRPEEQASLVCDDETALQREEPAEHTPQDMPGSRQGEQVEFSEDQPVVPNDQGTTIPEVTRRKASPSSTQSLPALRVVGNVPIGSSNRLGDLLLSAGIIDANALFLALENGMVTGLPLGLVLVGMGLINHDLLNNALTAQRLIRADVISRDKALHALKAAQLRGQSIHDSLQDYDWYARTTICTVDIGLLMNRAQILTTDQLLNVREEELLQETSLEELVISNGLVDRKCVEAAKQLLIMIEEGIVFEDQAIVILRRLNTIEGDPVPDFLLSLLDSGEFEIQIRGLLEDAGLLSAQQLDAACTLALKNQTSLVKTLHDTGLLEDWQLGCVLKCKESIDAGLFEQEQATIALLYALEQTLSFEDAIFLFGWTLPIDLAS